MGGLESGAGSAERPIIRGADEVQSVPVVSVILSGCTEHVGRTVRQFAGGQRHAESNVMCDAGNASLYWSSTTHTCLIWADG